MCELGSGRREGPLGEMCLALFHQSLLLWLGLCFLPSAQPSLFIPIYGLANQLATYDTSSERKEREREGEAQKCVLASRVGWCPSPMTDRKSERDVPIIKDARALECREIVQ